MSSLVITPRLLLLVNEELSQVNEELSRVHEEIAATKLEISSLKLQISRSEEEGKSETYLIMLGQNLAASKNYLVELTRKENNLSEQCKTLETKLGMVLYI